MEATLLSRTSALALARVVVGYGIESLSVL